MITAYTTGFFVGIVILFLNRWVHQRDYIKTGIYKHWWTDKEVTPLKPPKSSPPSE